MRNNPFTAKMRVGAKSRSIGHERLGKEEGR